MRFSITYTYNIYGMFMLKEMFIQPIGRCLGRGAPRLLIE